MNLKKSGIISVNKFHKNKDDFKMVKAICKDLNSKNILLNNGIKLMYCNYPVEEYIKPIKPLQCYNCQQFGHVAKKCTSKNKPICVKCGGEHKLAECDKNNPVKCANCNGNHVSSYGGCDVYQKFLKEKIEKVQNKPASSNVIRQYSQVAKQGALNEAIIDIKASFEKMAIEMKTVREQYNDIINNQIKILQSNCQSNFNKISKDIETNLGKQFYFTIDTILALFPHLKPNENQIKSVLTSINNHKINYVNIENVKSYLKKSS